jgi:diguanylate cyclase (GGDEF)-like protein
MDSLERRGRKHLDLVRRSRIARRALVGSLGLVASTILAFAGITVLYDLRTATEELAERGEVLSGVLASSLEHPLETDDAFEIDQAAAALAGDETVAWVRIQRPDGTPLSFWARDPTVAASLPAPAALGEATTHVVDGRPYLEFSRPVMGHPEMATRPHPADAPASQLATVQVAIDELAVVDNISRIAILALVVCPVAMLIAGLVALSQARCLLEPLSALLQGAKALAAGNHNNRIADEGADEIGEIARTLNLLADRIQSFEGDARSRNQQLLAEVGRQTEGLRQAVAESQALTRQAQAGVASRAQFLANISHEIRTPMNALLGMTELLLSARLSPEHRRLVETAHESGQALLTILNSILDFSKAESGQLRFESAPFALRDLVESVISLNAEQAAQRGIELGYQLDTGVPGALVGDPGRVRQILVNLMSNAVKFTQQGQVTIHITATAQADGETQVSFAVRDTGRGIGPADLSRLFQPFVQGDTHFPSGGTGLGLAISRELARRMGGDVTAESKVGVGSVFTFTACFAEAPAERAELLSLFGGVTRKVALLSRSTVGMDTLADQLQGLGLRVDRCQSVADLGALWARLGLRAPDLLVLDLDLSTDILLDALSELGRLEPIRRVPILLVGASGATVQPRVQLASGRAPMIHRPLRSAELLDVVGPLIHHESIEREAAPVPQPPPTLARALVVEDNSVNRIVAEGMLRQAGCTVELATSGEEGFALVQRNRYDIIFMDSQMPGWDGLRTTAAIRAHESTQNLSPTPVIALTAQAMPGDREAFLAGGMDDYLAKPLRLAELSGLLARWVKPAAPPPERAPAPLALALAPAEPTLAELDSGAIDALFALDDGAGETFRTIFTCWESSSADLLAEIKDAVAAGSAEALQAAAHPLKSSSASLGAVMVAALAQRLEQAGRSGNLAPIDRVVPRLERALDRARELLSARLLAPSSAAPAAAPQSGPLVMVVDDDPTIRAGARAALAPLECRIVEAQSGEEALARVADEMPALVLLDVMMHGMDGFATCQRLRAMPHGRTVPVLIMTGLEDMDSIATAYTVGATDFITKPSQPRILQNRVRYMLRAGDAATALRQNEEMLSAAQKMAGLGTWVCDTAGTLLRSTPEAERVYGVEGPVTLHDLHAFIHADDKAKVELAITDLRERGAAYLVHYRVAQPGRPLRTVQEQARQHLDGLGQQSTLLGAVLDITDQTEARARIHTLAYYDTVTGLPNRAMLMERLGDAIDRARQADRGVGLLFIDLDRFKGVNDTLGHSAGDSLLRSVANRVEQVLRTRNGEGSRPTSRGDLLARLGGDEFVILLPDLVDPAVTNSVAERVLNVLVEPFVINGHEVAISASVGTSSFPTDGEDIETLLRGADVAMYQAKEAGGNGVRHFTEATGSAAQKRFALEEGIRRGLRCGEFELYYQPKVDARTLDILGCEALIRWRHPERGLVEPGEFIQVAEQTGLIVSIGEWALRAACAQARAWIDQGLPVGRVAVNLSPRQFMQQNLVSVVRRALDDARLPPEHLELEVTESGVMKNIDSAILTMKQIGDMGVTLALDDFGTGYSSLNYLRRFPIHTLKIDRSFVQTLHQEGSEVQIITTTIIALGRALKLQVVAEGVETEAQVEVLRRAGCHQLQGYLISRPVPSAQMARLLAARRRIA